VSGSVIQKENIRYFGDPESALLDADALLILTPWPQYRNFDPSKIKAAMKGKLILDPYRVLNENNCVESGFDYLTLGKPAIRSKS
jgi:UDPglucose 6-dehydrogenase